MTIKYEKYVFAWLKSWRICRFHRHLQCASNKYTTTTTKRKKKDLDWMENPYKVHAFSKTLIRERETFSWSSFGTKNWSECCPIRTTFSKKKSWKQRQQKERHGRKSDTSKYKIKKRIFFKYFYAVKFSSVRLFLILLFIFLFFHTISNHERMKNSHVSCFFLFFFFVALRFIFCFLFPFLFLFCP